MASGTRDDCLDIVRQESKMSRITSSFWKMEGREMMKSVWDICFELPLKHTNGEVKQTVGNINVELNLGFISLATIEGMGVD